ncbi:hypothetical protein [Burkholderia pyrrocinia]|uniref:hypothetical protein n=1 Tax=Burkholderia pyrrocinia TaxID=60550 RepID=UPI002AB0F55A|nr:hypothetical protein [Burkholderia pyrrocinia]
MQFADDQESADEEKRPHAKLADIDGKDVAFVGQENENDGDGSQAVESFDVSGFAHEGVRALSEASIGAQISNVIRVRAHT